MQDKIEHDILVVRRTRQYFRIPAKKPEPEETDSAQAGPGLEPTGMVPGKGDRPKVRQHPGYGPPKTITGSEGGHRTIVNLGLGENWGRHAGETNAASAAKPVDGSPPRGPILSTLPLHPDPAASAACTCYLFNPDNLTYVTSWTQEEWNDRDVRPSSHSSNTLDDFELLVATAAGHVYLLQNGGGTFIRTEIDLRFESELWNLLRNGCVAGSVLLVAHPPGRSRVVPLVNVDALLDESVPRQPRG